MILVFRDT